MDRKKLEVVKMEKESIIEVIEVLKHCAYTYIEDEDDDENISAYTALGVAKILIEKLDINFLNNVFDEFIKEVEASNAEVFKK